METEKITNEKLFGSPKKSKNLIQSLINQGTHILGIDTYPNEDVAQLQVKSVKDCLKVIIKRTIKSQKEILNHLLNCSTGKNYKTQAEATAVTEYREILKNQINKINKK